MFREAAMGLTSKFHEPSSATAIPTLQAKQCDVIMAQLYITPSVRPLEPHALHVNHFFVCSTHDWSLPPRFWLRYRAACTGLGVK
jgi:hypothetical protein